MDHEARTGDRVYRLFKADLLHGSFGALERFDFAGLALRYAASTTPVRAAAMRLFGERLCEEHPAGGLRPTLMSAQGLSDLLVFHQRFVLSVIDLAFDRPDRAGAVSPASAGSAPALFTLLAEATGNIEDVATARSLGDRLAPVRARENEIIADLADEVANLCSALAQRSALKRLVRVYHRRRLALVPHLLWLQATPTGEPNAAAGAVQADVRDN